MIFVSVIFCVSHLPFHNVNTYILDFPGRLSATYVMVQVSYPAPDLALCSDGILHGPEDILRHIPPERGSEVGPRRTKLRCMIVDL